MLQRDSPDHSLAWVGRMGRGCGALPLDLGASGAGPVQLLPTGRAALASQTPAWPAREPALCLCCQVQRPGPGAVPGPWSLVRGHWGPEVKGLASPRRWEKCVEDLLGVRPRAGRAEGHNGDVAAVLQEGMCPPGAHTPPSRPTLSSRTFCVSEVFPVCIVQYVSHCPHVTIEHLKYTLSMLFIHSFAQNSFAQN